MKMGRRQGARSGAYLNRYVTDEQRSRRPILIATKAMLFRGQDTKLRQSGIYTIFYGLRTERGGRGDSQ
jgi:hypothetical protein